MNRHQQYYSSVYKDYCKYPQLQPHLIDQRQNGKDVPLMLLGIIGLLQDVPGEFVLHSVPVGAKRSSTGRSAPSIFFLGG